MVPEVPEAFLEADRQDLLAVLALRFGSPPEEVRARIARLHHPDLLARLILVAANAPTFAAFLEALGAPGAFRIDLDPIGGGGDP